MKHKHLGRVQLSQQTKHYIEEIGGAILLVLMGIGFLWLSSAL